MTAIAEQSVSDATRIVLFAAGEEGEAFFRDNLQHVWFDVDLEVIGEFGAALKLVHHFRGNNQRPDLVLVSNQDWARGGEDFVRLLRSHERLASLPIYCLAFCAVKIADPDCQCASSDWRKAQHCSDRYKETVRPLTPFLAAAHPARLDGAICADNIAHEVPRIARQVVDNWFHMG